MQFPKNKTDNKLTRTSSQIRTEATSPPQWIWSSFVFSHYRKGHCFLTSHKIINVKKVPFIANIFVYKYIFMIRSLVCCKLKSEMFERQIALVTGGAQGIGLAFVKEFLKNGIKVSLVDVNPKCGKEAEETLNAEFGPNKVIFIQADVSQQDQLEDAFKRSFDHWKGLDILINNAGIANENEWEKTVSINCMATVRATYLGFEYMSKLKGKKGGVIVNIASISGIQLFFPAPIYSASKSFVIAFTRALGHDCYYQHNEIGVLGVCPGATKTKLITTAIENELRNMIPNMKEKMKAMLNNLEEQPTEHVAKCVMDIIGTAKSGSIWIIEDEKLPYEVQEPVNL